jgi:hypothetical protein
MRLFLCLTTNLYTQELQIDYEGRQGDSAVDCEHRALQ